jgi:folate-binding protein YgfZ
METSAPSAGPAATPAGRLAAARERAAFGPPLARGLLRATGSKRLDFLNRMSSQKLAGLAPGESAYAAFLDGRGRVIAEGLVVVAREEEVLVDVDPAAAPALEGHLRRYVLRDDVQLRPAEAGLRIAPVLGPAAAAACAAARLRGWPNPRRGVPALDVLLPEGGWPAAREALLAAGAVELGADDLEVLRVLGGVARWGAEVDDGRLVMEAALTGSAVSFDKGCYLGQEIVLRGTFRGQVQRGLVQLDLPAGAAPGARLRAGEAEVGVVTSAVDAPEGRVGLGYLRRAHWAAGTRLAVDGGDAVVRRALVEEKD